MLADPRRQDVAGGDQLRAAMVIDDALRAAGGAARVVQRDRIPLVARQGPRESRIALGEQRLIRNAPHCLAGRAVRVGRLDHQGARGALRQGYTQHREKLGIDDDRLRLAVVEDVGDRRRVEPRVDGVEHGAGHRHAVMAFQHGRHVGQQRRDRVAASDPPCRQRRGQPHAPVPQLPIRPPQRAMHDGEAVREHLRRAFEEEQGRQRLVVGRAAFEMCVVIHVSDAAIPGGACPGSRRCPRRRPRSAGFPP